MSEIRDMASKFNLGIMILLSVTLMFSGAASAAKKKMKNISVEKIMLHDSKFGQCMVYISQKPTGVSCDRWLTLDCGAELSGSSKASANRKLNLLQLAKVTNGTVAATINDGKKINGYCLVEQVWLN